MQYLLGGVRRSFLKAFTVISEGILRCRAHLSSSKDWAGFLVGLTFMGFAFSVGTWHWWLERKVGLYAWVLVVFTTCVLSLITPDRKTTTAVLVFCGSYVSVARTMQWLQGGSPAYVPMLWTLGMVFLVSITPKWKLATIVALGMWAALSLKAVFLDGEPRALIITAIAIALIIGISLTARNSDV
jgi:hypothetical protein